MDVTDDAEIEIVIDPDNGINNSKREWKYSAQINTNDKFQMYGDYYLFHPY